MTSFREPTLYHTCTVATGALGTSVNNTYMPFERMCSVDSAPNEMEGEPKASNAVKTWMRQ